MTPEELRELAVAHERFDTDDYREGDAAKVLWLAGKRQQRAVLAALADAWEALGHARSAVADHVAKCEEGYCAQTVTELDDCLARLATLGEEKP